MSFMSLLVKGSEYLTPFTCLSVLSGKLADAKLGFFTQALIKAFIKTFKIDLSECEQPDITQYSTFNEFFVRKLREDARPVSEACIAVTPCDGTVGQAGDVVHGRLIQAKGFDYSLRALVGGNNDDCMHFEAGGFSTIYLSPANYHRVHIPMDGTLIKTVHIPGRLFPVGHRTVASVNNLFTLNERLVCIFETSLGRFAVIFVGAALVGSIQTVWDGDVTRGKEIETKYFDPGQYSFTRGQEIGCFKYGSTVITLWPEHVGSICADFEVGLKVQYGQPMLL